MKTIEQANYNELMRFALEHGLDVQYRQTKVDEVRSLIRTAFGDNVEIPEITAAKPGDEGGERKRAVPAEKVAVDPSYRNDPKVIVNIASDDANGGSRHYPICVNGDQIHVKRDIDVAIPYRHYLALKNARETVMRQEYDPARQKFITVETEQYAVRFSVSAMPSPEEIQAFHERTKDVGRAPVKAGT